MKSKITWKRINHHLGGSERKQKISNYNQETSKFKQETGDVPELIECHIDEKFYLLANLDVKAEGKDPAHHYFHYGAREGRNPTANFDTVKYEEHFKKFIPKGMNPFHHFLTLHLDENADDSHAKISGVVLDYDIDDLIMLHDNFDLGFYVSYNGFSLDTFENSLAGLIHYLRVGWRNGFDPSRKFSTQYYAATHPDIKQALINPFYHFLKHGREEGRAALPPRYKHSKPNCLVDLARLDVVSEPAAEGLELRDDVTIVIPVYNASEDTSELLQCLKRTLDPAQHIVVINDASTDKKIQPMIKTFEQDRAGTHAIHRSANLGFSGAVNDGIRLAEGRHLVLLNTDLVLPNGWLARLLAPIDASPETVGSVTPFSNTSSLTGFPEAAQEDPLFLDLSLGQIDDAFRMQKPVSIDLPSGCGFCLALSAAAIEEVGNFDTETYKRGYFEETDWCQRAVVAGFRHVMASNLFVEHKPGSSSFTVASRIALSEANKVKFNMRHPAFRERVRLFHYNDPAQRVRSIAKLQLWSKAASNTVLLISHSWGGGVSDYIERAEKRLLDDGVFVINLQCSHSEATVSFRHHSGEYVEKTDITTALEAILKLGIDTAEVHALHGSDSILEHVTALEQALSGVPYHVFVHDFVMACPTIHLVDDTGHFCGVPGPDKCLDCLHRNSESRYPILNISQWRAAWSELVQGASQIVLLDESAREIVTRAFPDIDQSKMIVTPPEYHPDVREVRLAPKPAALNIAILGILSKHKGAEVVRNLVRHIDESGEYHSTTLFGEWAYPHQPPNSLKLNGMYKAQDLPELLEEARTQVVLFPSVCPETFSFTLSEIFAMNIPVVGYEIGSQGHRIAAYEKGITVPMNDASSERLLDALKRAANL